MSIFPEPYGSLPGTKMLEEMNRDFARMMPREFADSFDLVAHPAKGAAAFSAMGLGMASHALGVWMGAAAGAAEVSKRMILPFLSGPTADDFRDKGKTPAKRASAAAQTLITDAQAHARGAADVLAKPVETPSVDAGTRARADEARAPAGGKQRQTPAADVHPTAPVPPVAKSEGKVPNVPAELMPEDFRQPKAAEKPDMPDDLKAISGIGPKLEQVLNGLGIWTYAQIAAWNREETAWVDDYLSFKGRIGRDGWIEQAAALAKGETKH
jgi:NADH-quinone oxidoreductase subunit E